MNAFAELYKNIIKSLDNNVPNQLEKIIIKREKTFITVFILSSDSKYVSNPFTECSVKMTQDSFTKVIIIIFIKIYKGLCLKFSVLFGYIIWRNSIKVEYPKLDNKKITAKMSEEWKNLDVKDKEKYEKIVKN